MYKRFIIFIIFSASTGLFAKAQTFNNLFQADSVTYVHFKQGSWRKLVQAGNEALQVGIDFYYLRMRMGIAFFRMGNYQEAIRHFENAEANNPGDPYLMEYLYFARLYSGRRAEALYGVKSFTPELKKSTGTDKVKWTRQVDIVYNHNFAGNASAIEFFNSSGISADEEGGQFISDGHKYFYAGLHHELSPSFSYYHAYTGLSKTHFAYVQRGGLAASNRKITATLNQYYGLAQVRVAKNMQLLAGLHYVGINFQTAILRTVQGTDNLVWQPANQSEGVLLAGLSWQATYFSARAMGYTANLNGRKQVQADAQISVYPSGNLNLYVSGQLSLQRETQGETKQGAVVFESLAGGRVSDKLWLEAFGAFGPQQNYIAAQGAVLFNTLDRVTSRAGARLYIFPAANIKLLVEGVRLHNESTFQGTNYLKPVYNNIPFNSYSITGGVSWYF